MIIPNNPNMINIILFGNLKYAAVAEIKTIARKLNISGVPLRIVTNICSKSNGCIIEIL
jgi:hypothetical protein